MTATAAGPGNADDSGGNGDGGSDAPPLPGSRDAPAERVRLERQRKHGARSSNRYDSAGCPSAVYALAPLAISQIGGSQSLRRTGECDARTYRWHRRVRQRAKHPPPCQVASPGPAGRPLSPPACELTCAARAHGLVYMLLHRQAAHPHCGAAAAAASAWGLGMGLVKRTTLADAVTLMTGWHGGGYKAHRPARALSEEVMEVRIVRRLGERDAVGDEPRRPRCPWTNRISPFPRPRLICDAHMGWHGQQNDGKKDANRAPSFTFLRSRTW